MAWTWRKRKTLIPGVRLNFGKKGISTSIGPRGASLSFGPNGTYLNTSIPGTGLYNRQKIGSGKGNADNIGCKEGCLIWLSFGMWILVACAILLGFAVDTWIGLSFLGVTIVAHIIAAIIANKKEKEFAKNEASSNVGEALRSAIYHEEIEAAKNTTNNISEKYYNQVIKAAEDLYADYENVLKIQGLETLVDSMGVKIVINGSSILSVREKVRLLFLVDIIRCYIGLGHPIDLDSKEGLGVLYFIALTKGCSKNKPYTYLSTLKGAYQSEASSIIKGVKAYIDASPAISETFMLSRLLSTKDTMLHQKFLVDIYRFASITAKADNTVTKEEAEWLGNIMKLQGSGDQEFVPQEDEQEEEEFTPISAPHIPDLDPLFADAARWIVDKQEGSTSQLQRKFEIGYNRAGKLSDQLEAAGIVGPNRGAAGREVLIKDKKQLERLLMGIIGDDYSNPIGVASTTPPKGSKPRTNTSSKMLDELIGLGSVKKEVETLSNFVKIQQAREAKGLKTSSVSYHCVFTGNPGTGKTTVARILAKIYKDLGVVSKGHLVETDRAGLVAEYVGQTAVKTNKIIDSALDGVLFIDEAYSLISGSENDFGKEAIATLLKRMEDNRDRLIVILAGYTKNMKDFIDSNPGLQSRFNRYIEFPDYSADELLQIFEVNMKKYEYHFGEGAKEHLQKYFENEVAHKDANFGNGRLVRNVFEKTLERQANRLAQDVDITTEKLTQINVEDLPIIN